MCRKVSLAFEEHEVGGWSVSVQVDGESEGWASGPTFASVYEVASDILFPTCDVGCPPAPHRCEPIVQDATPALL